MTISKPYLTLITSVTLTGFGLIVAHRTGTIILAPALFALGVPLVNIDKPLKQKAALTFAILIASVSVFIATVFAIIGLDFDNHYFIGPPVGLAGLAFLGINELLIDNISVNFKNVLFIFFLSGISVPIGIFFIENVFLKTHPDIDRIRLFGATMFWMVSTTVGICSAIKPKKNEQKP